jgi:uncharacterized protein (TIGR02996 family)
MAKACFDADPDEQTPLLILADLLQEKADPREKWVRAGVAMWSAASAVEIGVKDWNQSDCQSVLNPICESPIGWRVASMWGYLVAWHAPAGDGTERKMGQTWADERVRVVQRSLWFWSMGFLNENPLETRTWNQADAARSQANAAGSQADVAWNQANAAGSQANAARSQAYAARSQANAAGSQANAAWNQANAAWRQANAAWNQANAAWNQANAAWNQADVWRFARSLWERVCEPQIVKLS